jgi:hypothetical protein
LSQSPRWVIPDRNRFGHVRELNVSGLAVRWVDAAGYIASVLVFAKLCMRTMGYIHLFDKQIAC